MINRRMNILLLLLSFYIQLQMLSYVPADMFFWVVLSIAITGSVVYATFMSYSPINLFMLIRDNMTALGFVVLTKKEAVMLEETLQQTKETQQEVIRAGTSICDILLENPQELTADTIKLLEKTKFEINSILDKPTKEKDADNNE